MNLKLYWKVKEYQQRGIVFASLVALEADVCRHEISQETLAETNSITYNMYHILAPRIKGIVRTWVKTSWEQKKKKSYISTVLKLES